MIQNEFVKIESELAELWWRVPITFAVLIVFLSLIAYVNELDISRHSDDASQSDSFMAGPLALFWLRVCAIGAAARFGWIYFASIDNAWFHEISRIEACGWLIYIGTLGPWWLWEEKELLCMPPAGSRNARN